MDKKKFRKNLREYGFHEPFNWDEIKVFYLALLLEHLDNDFIETKITNDELEVKVNGMVSVDY